MIMIEFVYDNDIIVFADHIKGEAFVSMLSKKEISEGKILITRT